MPFLYPGNRPMGREEPRLPGTGNSMICPAKGGHAARPPNHTFGALWRFGTLSVRSRVLHPPPPHTHPVLCSCLKF